MTREREKEKESESEWEKMVFIRAMHAEMSRSGGGIYDIMWCVRSDDIRDRRVRYFCRERGRKERKTVG